MNRQIGIIERCNILYRGMRFKELGLNGCSHSYLIAVCNNPGISQEKIARCVHVNKSNVARNIAFLEENGFVYREESSADKRSFLVYPTQKALDIKPMVMKILSEWDQELSSFLSNEERLFLNEILTKIADNALRLVGDSE